MCPILGFRSVRVLSAPDFADDLGNCNALGCCSGRESYWWSWAWRIKRASLRRSGLRRRPLATQLRDLGPSAFKKGVGAGSAMSKSGGLGISLFSRRGFGPVFFVLVPEIFLIVAALYG